MASECIPWRTLARVQLAPSSGLIMTPWPIVPTRMVPFVAMLHLLTPSRASDYTILGTRATSTPGRRRAYGQPASHPILPSPLRHGRQQGVDVRSDGPDRRSRARARSGRRGAAARRPASHARRHERDPVQEHLARPAVGGRPQTSGKRRSLGREGRSAAGEVPVVVHHRDPAQAHRLRREKGGRRRRHCRDVDAAGHARREHVPPWRARQVVPRVAALRRAGAASGLGGGAQNGRVRARRSRPAAAGGQGRRQALRRPRRVALARSPLAPGDGGAGRRDECARLPARVHRSSVQRGVRARRADDEAVGGGRRALRAHVGRALPAARHRSTRHGRGDSSDRTRALHAVERRGDSGPAADGRSLSSPGGDAAGLRHDRARDASAHDWHRQGDDEVGGAAMPARTGEQYIKGLQQQEPEVWLGGERIKNVTLAAWGAAAEYFGRGRPEFADNIRRYYEHIRENDLTLTHSLINLQRSRTLSGVFNLQEGTALQVKRETDAGVIVSGARVLATLGPLADEIAVYSPRLARHTEPHSPFALNFAIPCGTPGLRFLCRESFDLGRSHFDHPLGSRFEEMDCVVFFDDVLVPWERVFLLGDVDLLNGTAMTTHSAAHTAHQNAAKNLAKCEFVLGVALLMTETLGNAQLPHSEERLGELTMYTELMRACMRAAEADAQLDQWGVMCPVPLQVELTRNLFMTAYPRVGEILQLLGSASS